MMHHTSVSITCTYNNPLISSSLPNCCCCSCCCCCTNSRTNLVYYNSHLPRFSITPSFVSNRLRQSTLINFAPSRRFLNHGRRVREVCDGNSSRFSVAGFERNSYERLRKLGKSRYVCRVLEDESSESGDEFVDEVGALLDLLNEEVGFGDVGVRERTRVSEKKKKGDRYVGVGDRKRVEVKDARCVSEKKKNVRLGRVDKDLKRDDKGVKIRSRVEEGKSDLRKEGSNCSSYYSVASTGEYESDNDVEVIRDDSFVRGESSSEYKDDREMDSYRRYDEEVKENVDGKQSEKLKKNIAEKYYGNQEWRKTSEKKLNVESSEQHSERSDRIIDQSKSGTKYKRLTETSTTERDNRLIGSSTSNQKRYSDTENKLSTSVQQLASEHKEESSDHVTRQNEYIKQTNVLSEASHDADRRKASSSSSQETRMKNWEDNSTSFSGRVDNRREERHQRVDHLTALRESRIQSQQASQIYDTRISKTDNAFVSKSQSDTRSEKQERHLESKMKSWEDDLIEISGRIEDRREDKQQKFDQLATIQESSVNSQQISEVSDTHIDKSESSLVSRRRSDIRREKQEVNLETRMKNSEDNLVTVGGRVEDQREENYQKLDQLTAVQESRLKSQHISESSDSFISNTDNTSVSRRQSDNVTEVTGRFEDRREENYQKIDQLTAFQESRVKSQEVSEITDTRINRTENTSVSLGQSDIRSKKQELQLDTSVSHVSSSGVKMGEGTNESLKTGRKTTKSSSFNVGMPREGSSSYKALKLNPEPKLQETGYTRGGGNSSSLSVVSTSSAGEIQEPSRDTIVSADQEQISSSRYVSEFVTKAKHELSGSKAELVYEEAEQHEGSGPSDETQHETGGSVQVSSSGVKMVEGTMESMRTGRRTTKASSFNVGMHREPASSYKAMRLIPERKSQESGSRGDGKSGSLSIVSGSSGSSAGEIQEPLSFIKDEDAIASADQQQISSSHYVGDFVDKAQHELGSSGDNGSGNSDQNNGATGPSDEIWHEAGETIQQPLETDAPDNTVSTENDESVKRSGRSVWNVIGDVVRLRWASPRSETNTPKSGGASSIQSTNSDTWFSGHEPSDSNDENVKSGSKKGRSRRHKDVSNPSSSKQRKDSPLLSSSSDTNLGSSSKTMSPLVLEESSLPLPAIGMRRSPAVKSTSVPDETDASTSGNIDQLVPKPLTQVPQAGASGSGKMVIADQPVSAAGVTDGELKRRKLARIDQVSQDKFDEWEEAYTVEAKQRQNDEIFMREALLEAKKAADLWEVPVGAVLVQDGKVIARGYNLVEELRDSTAHAEMICIREASNNLRSWSLSGTTLYVTLEPCPMCAGAILQARIDTIVWGAPNKLLGADGSWIRLFPDGDGGNGSDKPHKPPAPVHPFHPNMTIRRGVLSAECADVMQQFFQLRRKKKEKRAETQPPTQLPSSSLPITHHHRSKFFSKMHDAFHIMFCL
ncbi:CMP/dCMP deaminase, zinc-binding [Artemisia annua]|uniref:tRNA(adenine(34)) deaminase n=1 Tax=Artemisia annua TaxID=35608 RepID=A0A2U1LPK2_ARTAN|nr:CMP/dCMP deaminase, zinc-binding [Artemisia annua]